MNHLGFLTAFLVTVFLSCTSSSESNTAVQKGGLLSASDFAAELQKMESATILDVRTPSEFESGHLSGAINLDISSSDFESGVKALDPTKPVFVYCLSGGRSSSAAQYLRSQGFTTVNDLQGGILQWRAAKLPLEQGVKAAKLTGMTQQEFDALLTTEQLVLVDFYAEWCQPCKRMEPYLNEISKEMADKVKVVRIDVDANRSVSDQVGVTVLPTLLLYKKGKISWKQEGFIEKEAVVKTLKGVWEG